MSQWPKQNHVQHTLTTTLTTILAAPMLYPPDGYRAIINIIPRSNKGLVTWSETLPQRLVTAAEVERTGTSDATAAGRSVSEREEAVGKMLLLNVVVEDQELVAGSQVDM